MTQPIETVHLDLVIANHTRNMTGRLAAITGTTSGTGYVCAREMAKRGAIVVLLNRESERSASSLERLQADVPGGEFHAVSCDLQHFGSVRSAIKLIRSNTERIDVLCNNAGVMALKDEATRDGYDVQMQTNCLSHFLLTKALFDLLLQSDDARIVNHTSMARIGSPLETQYFRKNGGNLGGDGDDQEQGRIGGPRWERYHQSKLANCAFTYGLKHRLEKAGIHNVKALLAHPGLARTQLAHTTEKAGGMDASSPFMDQAQSAEDGATGIIRACMDPKAKSGNFYGPKQWTGYPNLIRPEKELKSPENILVNWEGCGAAVGKFFI
jgi:NAD(P)-dependent dehydrogenase (short-subunit alcohol dehydrogenase family)